MTYVIICMTYVYAYKLTFIKHLQKLIVHAETRNVIFLEIIFLEMFYDIHVVTSLKEMGFFGTSYIVI